MGSLSVSSAEHGEWPEAVSYVAETGGHAPSVFAKTMCTTIPIEPQKTRLLDVGCGSGIVGIFCLVERGATFVTFNDIQEEMISVTRSNVARQVRFGVISEQQANYLVSPFQDIPEEILRRHDLIAFNPPQLPEGSLPAQMRLEIHADPSMSYFRLGGSDGLDIVRQFLQWYSRLNEPMPKAVVLLSSFLGLKRISLAMDRGGIEWKILARTRVPLRRILCDAAERLLPEEREDSSLISTAPGEWTKELLTVSLQRQL